ncbi:acetyl-CoA carboxylase biotin carboxylase subunit family protein [Mesorhizobium salmacidum]|uniref:Acetyl-CoA carboxylase biotin carboxylase subunit family protein n=1 Tax=Mesorhizobium salmacidum TaxID=3015171 RepID=A0ABU8L5H2_9HYPH
MKRRALLLLEGHESTGHVYVKMAQHLDLHPITLSADPTQYDYLAKDEIETIRVDTDKLDALIHEVSRLRTTYDIAGATAFSGGDESAYIAVSRLCQHFDLPGPNPLSIERCCDKFTQRQLLAAAGLPIPAFRLAANATDVESSAAEIGLPVVLKPAAGSGSSGVHLCRSADELAAHAAYLLSEQNIRGTSPRILVEEFAQGPFFSAHIMGNEVIGIDAAEFGHPPHFVFRHFTCPAPLTDGERERIADVSRSCLPALGLGWGPTNVDLRWTKRGPVVIEVNPRLAGGTSPRLIQAAYGVDLITEHIKLVTGNEWDLRAKHSHIAAAQCLNADRDGILDWVDGYGRAAAVPGVAEAKLYIKPKTPIVRKGDYRDRIGHVIAASTNRARTEAVLQHATSLISWSIAPFPTHECTETVCRLSSPHQG